MTFARQQLQLIIAISSPDKVPQTVNVCPFNCAAGAAVGSGAPAG